MSLAVYFVVDGPPVGKGRPRVSTIAGRPRLYTPAKTQAWEVKVAQACKDSMSIANPSEYPWSVRIVMCVGIPVSWPKWRKQAALGGLEVPGRPDLDNVAKAVLDACNGIVYFDDSQVTRLCIEKRYAEHARTEVYMYEVCE
jgi:Holliday junction resolvase RusA-like endonuclease